MNRPKHTPAHIIKWTYCTFIVLMAAWIVAWILKTQLDPHSSWLSSSLGGFAYWTTAKLFLWILPALWLIHLSGRSLAEVFGLSRWRSWLTWGGGIGLLIALTGFIPSYLSAQPILPTKFTIPLLNVLIVAPMFEEFLIRGAIFGNLKTAYSPLKANSIASFLFLLLHLPGWYFMGVLMENLTKPVGGALSIFFLGLAFGYVVHRSRSVIAGMIAHFLNNLA